MTTRAKEETATTAAAATSAYQRGQQAATRHQQAAIALLIALREKTEETAENAIAASDRAAASDLAFVAPVLGFGERGDGLAAFAEAHKKRAAALFARKQSRVLASYRAGYEDTTSASGAKSKNNGDAVARALAGLGAGVVVRAAEILLGWPLGSLAEKYALLNEGQKRMNSGNRIRNGHKKGLWDIGAIETAIKTAVATKE